MAETHRKFDQDFREGAVRLVRETGKPIAQVARDLGINDGTMSAAGGDTPTGMPVRPVPAARPD
jgi:transposase-like protein